MNKVERHKFIRDRMFFCRKYTARELYKVYDEIMNCEEFIENEEKVKYETLRDDLTKDARVDGSWISKEGDFYFKTEPEFNFSKAHDWVNAQIRKAKLRELRRKRLW